MQIEEWRDVFGYQGMYKVSNLGRVRSLLRKHAKGRILKQRLATNYLGVSLCRNGVAKCVLVHRLVATAFHVKPNEVCEVNHKDFNKLNNAASNLEWVTRKQNARHAVKGGRHRKKLSEEAVLEIKQRLDGGEPALRICKDYGVTSSSIYKIKWGKVYF